MSQLATTAITIALTISPQAIAAELTGTVTIHERPVRLERHRLYSKVEYRCEVVFPIPGNWDIEVTLSDTEQYFGWSEPGTAFADTLTVGHGVPEGQTYFRAIATDSLGRALLAVEFNGNDLAHLLADGPWHFCISANRLGSPVNDDPTATSSAEIHAMTRAWRREEFETVYSGELDPYGSSMWESRSGEELVFTQDWDLMVAQIVQADTGGTRHHPPSVTLRVDQVLRGRNLLGARVAAWKPQPLWLPCGVGEEANIARWGAHPYPAPPVGSRWILGGYHDSRTGLWSSNDRCRWPYSDSTLTYFRQAVRTWRPKLAHLRRLLAKQQERELKERRVREARARPPQR